MPGPLQFGTAKFNYLSFDMFGFVRQIRDEKEQILQISWENEEGAAKKQQHYSVNCCQHKCEPRSGNFHLFFWSFLFFFCTHWQYVLGLFFEAKPLLVLSNFGGGPFEGMYREVFRDNIPSTLSARETLIARQKSISLKKLFSGFERKLKLLRFTKTLNLIEMFPKTSGNSTNLTIEFRQSSDNSGTIFT